MSAIVQERKNAGPVVDLAAAVSVVFRLNPCRAVASPQFFLLLLAVESGKKCYFRMLFVQLSLFLTKVDQLFR